jgi:hypothetical protein
MFKHSRGNKIATGTTHTSVALGGVPDKAFHCL